jgi:alkylation response protein AidB-like acyl-CoA dehydrogenase
MRSLSGPKRPDKPADPIIVHPDMRRMLLTCKALAEGGRALGLHAASLVDIAARSPDAGGAQRCRRPCSASSPRSSRPA